MSHTPAPRLPRELRRRARLLLRGERGAGAGCVLLLALCWWGAGVLDAAAFRAMGSRLEWFGGDGFGPAGPRAALAANLLLEGCRLLLLLPLGVGAAAWFDALARGESPPFRLLLWGYRVWPRSLGAGLLSLLGWGAALAPLLAGLVLWLGGGLDPLPPAGRWAAAAGFFTFGGLWLLGCRALWGAGLYLAPVLLGPGYRLSLPGAVRASWRAARGRRWQLLRLELSLLPAALACLLVLPALWALPFLLACRAVWARALLEGRYRA